MKPTAARLQQERDFHLQELLFSTTDKKGIIQSGNEVFVRVSGYQFSELLGQPHNIIRHPDMPRAVFKLLWDYLDAGKSVVAYVKNMAKDGRYYWVIALVTPLNDSYFSIRLKPSTELLISIQALYKNMLELERQMVRSGQSLKDAMQASGEKLMDAIKEKGFANYDEFMHFALRSELKNREQLLAQKIEQSACTVSSVPRKKVNGKDEGKLLQHIIEQSESIAATLNHLFSKLDDFVLLGETLEEKVEFIADLAQAMRVLSLNTGISSSHLNIYSDVFNSIAKLMVENSNGLNANAQRMGGHLLQISAFLKNIVYDLGSARVQLELLHNFLAELQTHRTRQQQAELLTGNTNSSVARILILQDIFSQTYKRGIAAFQQIENDLNILTRDSNDLQRSVQTLQFVHLVSRVEISRDPQLIGFGNILEEVLSKIENTKSHLTDLSEAVLYLLREVGGLGQTDRRVSGSLQQMSADTQLLATEAGRA